MAVAVLAGMVLTLVLVGGDDEAPVTTTVPAVVTTVPIPTTVAAPTTAAPTTKAPTATVPTTGGLRSTADTRRTLARVLSPIPGYTMVDVPPGLLREVVAELASDPDSAETFTDVAARNIVRSGTTVAWTVVYTIDERHATLANFANRALDDLASEIPGTQRMTLAGQPAAYVDSYEAMRLVAVSKGGVFIVVYGVGDTTSRATLEQIARELVGHV